MQKKFQKKVSFQSQMALFLYVGNTCNVTHTIFYNRQYLHFIQTIGVSFGNSKPLQTWY